MTERESTNGTTRRAFLGAAAAAAGLTTAGVASATDTATVETDDVGSTRATYPDRSGFPAFLDLGLPQDWDSTLTVKGYRYDDDEEGSVEVTVGRSNATLTMNFTPEQARSIADDLEGAADHVEGNDGGD